MHRKIKICHNHKQTAATTPKTTSSVLPPVSFKVQKKMDLVNAK